MLSLFITSAVIIVVIQMLFFILAAYFKTDKVTDLSYGLTFVIVSWVIYNNSLSYGHANFVVPLMVTIWGLRLSGFLFVRILKTKKDKRFDGIREDFLKFAKFWLLQGVAIFIIMLPAIVGTAKDGRTFGAISIFGFLIYLCGVITETIADYQKFMFKSDPSNEGRWTNVGLFKYARHPNYFGEILTWWGIYIFAFTTLDGFEYLTVAGPIFITLLLLFVTGVPPLEKAYEKRYAENKEYQKYKNSTRLLLPFPKKIL